jgi:hypothetical protein
MRILSYWVLPIISGLVWLGMLLGLLLYWIVGTSRTHYPSMDPRASIAYISDVGASELKPLFVAGCAVSAAFLDLGFLADRLLRHNGRLAPNMTRTEKVLSAMTIFFAIVGTAGLVLLSVFDTLRYPQLHDIFLLLFIGGFLLSAIFICWEYQRLGIQWRQYRVLGLSFWIKLTFVLVEFFLAIAFVATTWTKHFDAGATIEWTIAFIFSFYIFSFVVDLYPAVHTRAKEARFNKPTVRELEMGSGPSIGEGALRAEEEMRGPSVPTRL